MTRPASHTIMDGLDDDQINAMIEQDLDKLNEVSQQLSTPLNCGFAAEVEKEDTLGSKLRLALIDWRNGPKMHPVAADLLKVMREHGFLQNWSARETANAERKLRLLLRRIPAESTQPQNKRKKRRRRS
uniref:Uncharacterized protein n=1 Tax=Spongospora subterranea TaxID=70186 RepID=A0A0H5QNJ5_9EUKA|eukprot:CRZ03152.1 hypothetical protein [Spongospora subterranea]